MIERCYRCDKDVETTIEIDYLRDAEEECEVFCCSVCGTALTLGAIT